jgi:hypothetical protein
VTTTFDGGKEFVPPDLDMDDMRGFLLTLQAQGWPEGLLIKQAIVSIRALHRSAERWQRTEGGYVSTAPLWLDENERDKLLALMRGAKGVEARGIRQALQDMFPRQG